MCQLPDQALIVSGVRWVPSSCILSLNLKDELADDLRTPGWLLGRVSRRCGRGRGSRVGGGHLVVVLMFRFVVVMVMVTVVMPRHLI